MLKSLRPVAQIIRQQRTIMSSIPPPTTETRKRSLSPGSSIPQTSILAAFQNLPKGLNANSVIPPSSKKLRLNEPTTTPSSASLSEPIVVETPVASTSSSLVIPIPKQQPKQNPNKANKANRQAQKDARGGKKTVHKPGGAEETGEFDVIELLGLSRFEEMRQLEEVGVEEEGGKFVKRNWKKESEVEWGVGKEGRDLEVRIVGMSAHGDGLAILTPSTSTQPTRLLSIPFTLPGELILAHIHRHEPDFYLSHADLIKIIEPSSDRSIKLDVVENDKGVEVEVGEELKAVREKFGERVMCKYFGTCSGCQYQPLSYDQQLLIKQTVVRKAFANFSGLSPSQIPAIGSTIPSPKQYAYRTKLTPHFQSPPVSGKSTWKDKRGKGKGKGKVEDVVAEGEEVVEKEWELTIGFEEKGRKRIVDIEECVIATKVINDALIIERQKVKETISSYKRGSTLLLRDSLPPRVPGTVKPFPLTTSTEPHICITDHHAVVREQIKDIEFEQMAGSFFQNNNSILPSLLNYIREAVHPSSPSSSTIASNSAAAVTEGEAKPAKSESEKTYLIDAYCGSGLFAIGLADQFDQIEGVEIDKASVKWAKLNADYNKGEGRGEVGFRAGNAEAIFDTIKFPPGQTTIVIDPPRKGCDPLFLQQLLAFNPATIIYVSCNVHTQARDIGYIVTESQRVVEGEMVVDGEAGNLEKGFRIESLRAADLFANTHHAEGVAVLRRHV